MATYGGYKASTAASAGTYYLEIVCQLNQKNQRSSFSFWPRQAKENLAAVLKGSSKYAWNALHT